MAAPVSAQATENNQRLFVRYAKVFRDNDVAAYAVHAHKLATWLRDSKAYYTAARPEIIKLLLIAQISLRQALGFEQEFTSPFNITNYTRNPMIDAYAHLVGTVEPYLPLFVEPALLEHISGLVATIHPPALSQIPDPPSQLSRPIATSAEVDREASAPPETNNLSFSDPDVQIIENPNCPNSTSVAVNQTSTSSPAVKPAGTAMKAKAKKRKSVVDFSVLAQRDIEGLMKKKQAARIPQPTQSVINSGMVKPMSPPASIPPEPSTSLTSSEFLTIAAELSLAEAGQSSDLRSTPPPPPLDTSEIITQLSNDISTHSDNSTNVEASTQMNVDEAIHRAELFEQLDGLNGTHEPANKTTEEEFVPTDVEEAVLSLPAKSRGQPEISDNAQAESDPLQEIHPVTETPVLQRPSSVPPTSAPGKDFNVLGIEIIPVPVVPLSGVGAPATTPHATNGNQVPVLSQSPLTGEDSPIFGPEMYVVASQIGLKEKSRISIHFETPELQFGLVSRWIARRISPQDVKSSICLTLGCYLNDNLVELLRTHENCDSLEKQVSLTRSAWPSHGDLTMNVNARGSFPLCPPFQMTPDGLVDVSEFLSLGQNVIELNQRQDLSQYRFVLHGHYPTRKQLKELESRKQMDQSWSDWLLHVSRPMNIPLKPSNQAC